jgi:hypothetical protein
MFLITVNTEQIKSNQSNMRIHLKDFIMQVPKIFIVLIFKKTILPLVKNLRFFFNLKSTVQRCILKVFRPMMTIKAVLDRDKNVLLKYHVETNIIKHP